MSPQFLDADIVYASIKPAYADLAPENHPTDRRKMFDFEPKRCSIAFGDREPGAYTVKKNGFEIVRDRNLITDKNDLSRFAAEYADSVSKLIMRSFSAKEVFLVSMWPRGFGENPPVLMAHNDYTDEFARHRARKILSRFGKWRDDIKFDFVQTWRPLVDRVEQNPLGFCLASSLEEQDLSVFRMNYFLKYNPEHEWVFFDEMTEHEILIFCGYSSTRQDMGRICPHTSFQDPRVPSAAQPRKSIETRAVVIYE